MIKYFQYFVEGECEEKLINALKIPPCNFIIPGKVEVFNVIQNKLSKQRILSIKPNATIILVYDTDIRDDSKLIENIKLLNNNGFKNIIHIQSVKNFEDEIKFSCSIKSIHQIFQTKGRDEFKSKFIHCSNIINKLTLEGFEINKLWIRKVNVLPFSKYVKNQIDDIKRV